MSDLVVSDDQQMRFLVICERFVDDQGLGRKATVQPSAIVSRFCSLVHTSASASPLIICFKTSEVDQSRGVVPAEISSCLSHAVLHEQAFSYFPTHSGRNAAVTFSQ